MTAGPQSGTLRQSAELTGDPRAQRAGLPVLFAEIFASNIGGTATLIGDPPNIMIGSQVGLSFNDFVIHLTPVIIVVMLRKRPRTTSIKRSATSNGSPSSFSSACSSSCKASSSEGACLGGNGTLIGASANLAGIGDRNGVPFKFMTFSLYAFPLMLMSVAISHLYVWWPYF